MGAFNVDSEGHMIVDETMSEELKEKILQYNALVDSEDNEQYEISDEEADSYEPEYDPEEDSSSGDMDDEEYIEIEEEESIGEEELNSLNDLFS